jgi:hypothetical protein
MKKVLVSEGFGAGFATWANNSHRKELAEDPELVALVERGEHKGETTYGALADEGLPLSDLTRSDRVEASHAFAKRAMTIANGYVYCGGVFKLKVHEVDGPYRIEEYDGSESLHTSEEWW